MDEDKSNNMGENAGDSGPEPAETPPDSGSVITPGDSDSTTAPEPATPIVGKSGGGKKKPLIILLIVLLLAAAGAAAYFLYFNKSDDSTQSTENTEETSQFVPSIFVQNGTKVQYLNENAELQDFTTLEKGEEVTEVIVSDDAPEVRYQKVTESSDGLRQITAYGSANAQEKTQLFSLSQAVDYHNSSLILSPDGSKLFAEVSDPTTGVMQKLVTINASTGEATDVYDPAEGKGGLLVFVDWVDNNSVLMQNQSCRQCDGPPLPQLSKLNLTNGEVTGFYQADANTTSFAEFSRSNGGEVVYMRGSDSDKAFEITPGREYENDIIVSINKASGEPKTLATDEDLVEFSGETSNLASVFVYTADYSENPTVSYTPYSKPTLQSILVSSSKKTDIAIESKYVREGSSYQKVVEYDGGILMLVLGTDPEDNTMSTQNLLKLPRSESGEAEIQSLLEGNFEVGSSISLFVVK